MNTKKFSIRFYPRMDKINKQKLIPIYARITADKKIELSTTILIRQTEWNIKTQRLKVSSNDADRTNAFLDSFNSKILDAYSKLFIESKPISADTLKEAVFGKVDKTKYLLDVVKEHNDNFEKRIGIDYSYGSFKNYKTTKKYLEAFLIHQYKKRDIPLTEVKYAFCEHYFAYLITVKPCNNNGASKHIQRLKKIINYAFKMGYILSNPLLAYSLKFKPFQQHKLTWEEIEVLQNLKLANEALVKVQDIFLFQCYTGLAYADVKKLSSEHIVKGIDNKYWIKMERTKTKRLFIVPLLKPAHKILNKYYHLEDEVGGLIFPVLSNQKMNAYLKIISEIAGLKKPLTCHIARHTFATTVTLLEGIPLETVSKLLGHSKISTTQLYSVVTEMKISKDTKDLMERLN